MTPTATPGVIRLRIPCAGEEEFLRRYAPRYGADGVFVPTDRPRPVGTRLQLRIEFRDGSVRVSGDALVTGHASAGRTGMTLRLTRLHPGGIAFALSPVGGPVPSAIPVPREGPATPGAQDPPAGLADRLFGDAGGLDEPAAALPLEVRTGKVKLRLQETGSPEASAAGLEPTPAPLGVVEPTPVGAVEPTPVGAVEPTPGPLGVVEPTPAPLGAVEPTPAPLAAGAAPEVARPARRASPWLLPLLALAVLLAAAAAWLAVTTGAGP